MAMEGYEEEKKMLMRILNLKGKIWDYRRN